MTCHLNGVCPKKLGGYFRYNTKNISEIPIILFDKKDEKGVDEKVTCLMQYLSEIDKKLTSFKKYIMSKFSLTKLSRKLDSWHKLNFTDFRIELNKCMKKLGCNKLTELEEIGWLNAFEVKVEEVCVLSDKCMEIEKHLNQLVYELYGLTDEEIAIIEDSVGS